MQAMVDISKVVTDRNTNGGSVVFRWWGRVCVNTGDNPGTLKEKVDTVEDIQILSAPRFQLFRWSGSYNPLVKCWCFRIPARSCGNTQTMVMFPMISQVHRCIYLYCNPVTTMVVVTVSLVTVRFGTKLQEINVAGSM